MKYGCIGEHLTHSFSKEIHNLLADYEYELKEISPDNLDTFLKNKDFNAVNVTIPYKQEVIKYLDFVDDLAKEIGAVNTIVNKEGKLYGYNTDFYGLKTLIETNDISLKNKKVLILGSGGTSKTALAVAKFLSAKEIFRISRTGNNGCITYEDAISNHNDADVIINTTPCGMYPESSGSPIDISYFSNLYAVIDVVYNPFKTDLISAAEKRGIKCCSGLYMLVAQASYAVEHFLDCKISAEKLQSVYKKILFSKQNIVLIGMPSCGKSTVGQLVAEYLGRDFYDTDTLIETKENLSIKEIFELYGESYFRKLENETIAEISKLSGVVISTGGGAVINENNTFWLKKNGLLFFIDRPLEKLICTKARPLSSNKSNLEMLYKQRHPIYCSAADYTLTKDNTFEELKELLKKEF